MAGYVHGFDVMNLGTPHYEIEFYSDPHGHEPCRKWMDGLTSSKRSALVAALKHVLARLGLDVCKTEYGKNLGKGVAEFRLRHSEQVILGKFADKDADGREASAEEGVLLRVFFHAHGNKMILLLGGFDKGKRPSERHQQREIERARKRLSEWKGRQ